jgi:serine phosphatase RsbU (regulator of sigma subunit)/anti-sigma regulatory factor (Ser/Thr protein kinase)
MKINDKNRDFTRRELMKMLLAVFIVVAISLVYYFFMRKEARSNAERRANEALGATETMILSRLGKIETIITTMQFMVGYSLDDPDEMDSISIKTIKSSDVILGAGVAFKENFYPDKGRWFMTYASYNKNGDTIKVEHINDEDYTKEQWYLNSIGGTRGNWIDPYYDDVDGITKMVSYSLSVYDEKQSPVGVIIADVSTRTIDSILSCLHVYPDSYYTIVTASGKQIVNTPDEHKGKCHTFTRAIESKNMILSLTIPDREMYWQLYRSSMVFALLGLLELLAIIFIAHRSVRNLKELNEVSAREQRMESELSVAREMQQSLMPDALPPELSANVDVSGLLVPARYVGGDLYDYIVRDGLLYFCVGDVSGKGVPAAMLMVEARQMFRTLSARGPHPDMIVHAMNVIASDNNKDLMFMTIFLGVMDMATGKVRYCNAGHNQPMVIRNGHASYLDTPPCLLLGVDADAKYEAHELTLASGDILFLYTDGLTEAENMQKELLGDERALAAAQGFMGTSAELIERMRRLTNDFMGQAEQSDDFTLLSVRFKPSSSVLTIKNEFEELAKLKPFVDSFLETNGIDPSVEPQLSLALDEALTNVVMYAYPKGQTGEAEIAFEVEGDNLKVTVSDHGQPFNPLNFEADFSIPLEERHKGGMGIHIIKEAMDAVDYEYCDNTNILKLTKKIIKTK